MEEGSQGSDIESPVCAVQVVKKGGQKRIGAAVRSRCQRKSMEDNILWKIELFEFADNDQFSNLDSLIVQLGACSLLIPEDIQDSADGKKIQLVVDDHSVDVNYCKKSTFKLSAASGVLVKLSGVDTYVTNTAETECPLGVGCVECLSQYLGLIGIDDELGKYSISFGSLSNHMRLDSAAASAINLLPRSDDPSPYGSLYGVLNRCKTKMGQRLLERWLRQPLVDEQEINRRLDVVELLKESAIARNLLVDGSLKGIPDIDAILTKIQKPNADLSGVYRLYIFTRALPGIIRALNELQEDQCIEKGDKTSFITERYIVPLQDLDSKLDMYRQLVEHVVDFDRLPDLMVAAKHDPNLMELKEEIDDLEAQARQLQEKANRTWGSFTDVKLESNSQFGFIFRTTKGDDERKLRANNSKIRILSMLKNGLHFTTPELTGVAERHQEVERLYRKQQAELVRNAVATARTYLPVVEAACALVSELDVLSSFATVAAVSPATYVRPTLSPLTTSANASAENKRRTTLKGARHPCVELMDGVDFIANDYDLTIDQSNFQIVTGPNMGGKSTYIRGLGSIVTLAQIGSFVPCEEAHIAVVDCVLARVGAGDAGQKGISTFMAEMLEASVLLETATSNSLVIIDELGRGTSTYDGFGLAWAIAEYITTKINPLCLFATHFHELTALAHHRPNVVNKHVSAIVENKEVVMLHNVMDGPCAESFGIHVAAMASFPDSVIREAKRKSDQLEDPEAGGVTKDTLKLQKILTAMNKFESLPVADMSASEARSQLSEVFLSP